MDEIIQEQKAAESLQSADVDTKNNPEKEEEQDEFDKKIKKYLNKS